MSGKIGINKTAIVTGGSRGIGFEAVKLLSKHGFNIVFSYNKSEISAKRLLSETKKFCTDVISVKADLTLQADCQNLINTALYNFNNIDVLVNNAGISQQKLFTDISYEEWKNMFTVNVDSMFNCTKYALKNMLKNHSGKIINISSMWGITGASCEVHYSASKAAVIGFTKALAKELGPSNIMVNCIAPGVIETDMNANLRPDVVHDLLEETPLGRIGSPLDVANSILYLANDMSNFVTGQVISVNGGFII